MIIKRNFNPLKVWTYIKGQMLFVLIWSTLVYLLFMLTQYQAMAMNFTPIGVLGSALAIFIAFRNNSAYGRWWEARKMWDGIVNSSRVLGRLVITFTDSHSNEALYNKDRSEHFKSSIIQKQIAWGHALRLQLREEESWNEIRAFLSKSEYETVITKQNKPNAIHLLLGKQIYEAMANSTLGGFDSFQLEGQLLALSNYQGACERIKNTPLPRQYDYFTRVFVLLFSAFLPFGLLGLFAAENQMSFAFLTIPLSLILAGVFIIMERTGAANENPFENKITDVALTSICNTIERDLKELLGEQDLPPKLEAINGYLY